MWSKLSYIYIRLLDTGAFHDVYDCHPLLQLQTLVAAFGSMVSGNTFRPGSHGVRGHCRGKPQWLRRRFAKESGWSGTYHKLTGHHFLWKVTCHKVDPVQPVISYFSTSFSAEVPFPKCSKLEAFWRTGTDSRHWTPIPTDAFQPPGSVRNVDWKIWDIKVMSQGWAFGHTSLAIDLMFKSPQKSSKKEICVHLLHQAAIKHSIATGQFDFSLVTIQFEAG